MWEYFIDESYYDMWAVRNTSDKSFTSAIHVMTEDEAKFLVEKLNELQKLQTEDITDYHDLYYGGAYTYSQPADIIDYFQVEPLKAELALEKSLRLQLAEMLENEQMKFQNCMKQNTKLKDFLKRVQDDADALVEPIVSCHNCGSTAGYYSLGKACKNCHRVA